MTLPDFLCIGAQKCGTSWLHAQLRQHPRVYVPTQRKELHFFDQYFDRGSDWYQGYFPNVEDARSFDAIGEVTPRYCFDPQVPERIHGLLPDCRLILMLRNPVDRLFSQYAMALMNGREVGSVQEFAASNSSAFERGCYAGQLERYLEYFPWAQIHVLIYEEVFASPEATREALASVGAFLGVSPDGFPWDGTSRRVNARGGAPRFKGAFRAARRLRRRLRDHDMDWVVRLAGRLGVSRRWFGGEQSTPKLDRNDREMLMAEYSRSISNLERLIGRSLDCWRPGVGDRGRVSEAS